MKILNYGFNVRKCKVSGDRIGSDHLMLTDKGDVQITLNNFHNPEFENELASKIYKLIQES